MPTYSSTTILSSIEAAAPEACVSRAMACPNAARRASRKAAWNSGNFCQRMSVAVETLTERAASSTLRAVSTAATASASLRLSFVPCPLICSHL